MVRNSSENLTVEIQMRRKTEDWPDNKMAMVEKRLIKAKISFDPC